MACRYTYQGETYEAHELDDVLKSLSPAVAAKYISEIKATPDAPFIGKDPKPAVALALKRMIAYAAENGFDRVAFVTGEQSAERYDLSKQVSRVVLHDNSSGGIGKPRLDGPFESGTLSAYDLDGRAVLNSRRVESEDEISELVGKEAARKLLEAQPKEGRFAGLGVRERRLDGLELKVGGEGMKAFYDAIVPQVANDVLRKIGGGKVGEVNLTLPGDGESQFSFGEFDPAQARIIQRGDAFQVLAKNPNSGVEQVRGGNFDTRAAAQKYMESGAVEKTTQPGFDITDAMREQVTQGLPLFRRTAETKAASTPDQIRTALVAKLGKLAVTSLERSGRLRIVTAADALNMVGESPEGWFQGDTAYLVADNLTPERSLEVLTHELGEHFGLKRMLGEQEYSKLLDRIKQMNKMGHRPTRTAWSHVAQNYPELTVGSETFLREVVARLGETKAVENQPWWQAILTKIRAFLTEKGWGALVRASDLDVHELLNASLRRAITEAKQAREEDEQGDPLGAMASRESGDRITPMSADNTPRQDDSPNGPAGATSAVDPEKVALAFDDSKITTPDRGLKIGAKQKIYRGTSERTGRNTSNFGRGLYTTTDKAEAAQYGDVSEMSRDDLPQNPLRFQDEGKFREWESFVSREVFGAKRMSEFLETADVWVRQIDPSIDGIQVGTGAGTFFVKFPNEPSAPAGSGAMQSRSDITKTEAFRKWFGASKVVDEDGEPLSVYHGTRAEFDAFNPRTIDDSLGFHFGFTRRQATGSRGRLQRTGKGQGRVIEAFVKVENPLWLKDRGGWTRDVVIREVNDKLGTNIPEDLDSREAQRRIVAAIKEAGYDGVFYKNVGEGAVDDTAVIAFDPTQIKSATGNNGNFDPSNPSILMSRGNKGGVIERMPEAVQRAAEKFGIQGVKREISKYRDQNKRFREEHITLWQQGKKWLRKELAPGGLLPKDVFAEKIKRDSEFEAIEFDVRHLIGQFERALKAEYGVTNTADLDEKAQRLLTEALAGKIDTNLKPTTKAALVGMRQYIDQLSKQYLGALADQIEGLAKQAEASGNDAVKAKAIEQIALYETILGNVGQYVHRSYRAFDDPKWPKKVPDAVLDAAREYLIARHLETGDRATAERRAEVTLNEILKNGTAYENIEGFIKESKLGAKDLSVLKKRKEIAPEIKALLGEYTDPRLNFSKSATKMGRLIWNQSFLNRIQEIGKGVFLFDDTTKPPEATSKIAADGSEVYAPLNGLWTFPEINQAFKDALGKEQMADWYRTIVQINGLVKFGKTVLSPTTAARNWMSAFFFTVANGHFDLTHMRKSVDGLKEYFGSGGDAKKLAYLRELKQLGVVYDTPYAGEMMRLLSDSRIEDTLGLRGGKLKVKHALDFATNFYRYGDDFWKIIGFENEKATWIEAGLSEQKAKEKAAERIRNTYPTYSMIGKSIQSLRRFPLAGTFVSFPAEIIRTSGNMIRYVVEDYKDPKTRKMAQKRAVGLMLVSASAYAAQALSMAMLGMDDDEEEAVRLMAAPWSKNSNLLFMGRDAKGNIRFLDLSFLDPYNYFKRPLVAMTRGQPIQDALKDVAKETLTPFFGVDILAGAVFEVLANKKGTGSPVYQQFDAVENQIVDIANHLRKAVQPGIVSNLERTYKAISGDTDRNGKKYDPADEAAGWVGFRVATLDSKVALYYRSFEFKDAKSEADKKLRDIATDPDEKDDEDLQDAVALNARLRAKAYGDMSKLIRAAQKSGMTPQDVVATLKNSGVTQQDIMAIRTGRVPPWRPDPQSVAEQSRKAQRTFGMTGAKRVRERYQRLSSYRASQYGSSSGIPENKAPAMQATR